MTLQEAKQVQGLTNEQKKVLENLEKTAIRFARPPREFQATNANQLKSELNQIIADINQRKAKSQELNVQKKQCTDLLKLMIQGDKDNGIKPIITPSDMFQRLQAMQQEIQAEQQEKKLTELIAQTGLTEQQVITILQNRHQ